MSFLDPRSVLKRHGLRPKRGYSQNFLCSPHAVERIAAAVEACADDLVVELGPGCGTLTAALLAHGPRVIAIERDPDMLRVLGEEFAHAERLTLRPGDATQVDYAALAHEGGMRPRVAGNLPYALTGAILRRLIDGYQHVARAVVMVQREVAERLMAQPGQDAYGALTVFAQNVFEVALVVRVPASAFHPKPKVDSAVVSLTPRGSAIATSPRFEAVVRAAFQARRKTLRNALKRLEGVEGPAVQRALEGLGLPLDIRGERLSVEAFDALARALSAV